MIEAGEEDRRPSRDKAKRGVTRVTERRSPHYVVVQRATMREIGEEWKPQVSTAGQMCCLPSMPTTGRTLGFESCAAALS